MTPTLWTSQTLASGLVIRQNVRTAARFVMFETDYPDWKYATHGGTAFVVAFENRPYGIVLAHTFGDFPQGRLLITDLREGTKTARLATISGPSQPSEDAEGSDINDLRLVRFHEGVGLSFFGDTAYVVEAGSTICGSRRGDNLFAYGALKAESVITETNITPTWAEIGLTDAGRSNGDALLRHAVGRYETAAFDSITGLSGAPVFNVSQGKLCGVVVRGGLRGGTECNVSYVDMEDVALILKALHAGQGQLDYKKMIHERDADLQLLIETPTT